MDRAKTSTCHGAGGPSPAPLISMLSIGPVRGWVGSHSAIGPPQNRPSPQPVGQRAVRPHLICNVWYETHRQHQRASHRSAPWSYSARGAQRAFLPARHQAGIWCLGHHVGVPPASPSFNVACSERGWGVVAPGIYFASQH